MKRIIGNRPFQYSKFIKIFNIQNKEKKIINKKDEKINNMMMMMMIINVL